MEEKTADELFEEWGYKKIVGETTEVYKLSRANKNIYFSKLIKRIKIDGKYDFLDMEELQAISKRCLELRWRECTSIEFAEKLIEDLQEKIRNLTEDNKNNIKIKLDFNGQNYTVDTKIPAKYKDGEILYLADEYKEPTRVKFFRYKVNQTVNKDFILYCEVLNLSNNKFEYYLEKNLFQSKSVASDEYLKRKYC